MIDEAVVICTRNRPDDLQRLLSNLTGQVGMEHRLVMIVDASDPDRKSAVKSAAAVIHKLVVHELDFVGEPSLARQRNFAVDALPDGIELIHFLDDDVELEPACLDWISSAFDDQAVGGAGGRVVVESARDASSSLWGRLFLLEKGDPGSVLISGASTPGQAVNAGSTFGTDWLGGCSTYRRSIFETFRFDHRLEGYSFDEDIDFSYRVGRTHKLVVVPKAVIHHHVSDEERSEIRRRAHDALVHRYWFLEKNIRHPFRKPAFWWATGGRLLATRLSRNAAKTESFSGLIEGIGTVWRRDHPLLRKSR